MVKCNRCDDLTEYEWYQDFQDRWKLGIKLDINNFRQHRCSPLQTQEKPNNKRNWVVFICDKCGSETRQNIKLLKPKELNLCLDCNSYDSINS